MRSPLALFPASAPATARKTKILRLADLQAGQAGRVVRVAIDDAPCRRRLAELGIAEGMVVSVAGAGETMMLALGTSRFALARSCAEHIEVLPAR